MKKSSLKNILTTSGFTLVAFASSIVCAPVAEALTDPNTSYVGADAVLSKMKFKQGYGDNLFSTKNAPGINVFAGHMFHENFGVEVGYEASKKMKCSPRISAGEMAAGVPVAAGQIYLSYDSTIKQHHAYFGAVGKHNIFNNAVASLTVGGSFSHIDGNYLLVTPPGIGPVPNLIKSYSKTKLIPIVKAAAEYKATDTLGIRASVTWKNTSKLSMQAKEDATRSIKPKDAFSVGVGAAYYIG